MIMELLFPEKFIEPKGLEWKFEAVFPSIVIEGPGLDRVIYYERPTGAQIAWKVY